MSALLCAPGGPPCLPRLPLWGRSLGSLSSDGGSAGPRVQPRALLPWLPHPTRPTLTRLYRRLGAGGNAPGKGGKNQSWRWGSWRALTQRLWGLLLGGLHVPSAGAPSSHLLWSPGPAASSHSHSLQGIVGTHSPPQSLEHFVCPNLGYLVLNDTSRSLSQVGCTQ